MEYGHGLSGQLCFFWYNVVDVVLIVENLAPLEEGVILGKTLDGLGM